MESNPSDEGDVNYPPPIPEQLITISNGRACLDVSKFRDILSKWQESSNEDNRAAFICIIGQSESGKSFLANMILQNLLAGGDGNWIGPVTKKRVRLEGFSWNQQNTGEVSSISMLSRPFNLKKCNGERSQLFLMDCSTSANDVHAEKMLEALVWLLCPTVVVNQMQKIDVELLKLRNEIFKNNQPPFSPKTFFTIREHPIDNKTLPHGKSSENKFNKYVEETLKASKREDLSSAWEALDNKIGYAFASPGNPTIIDADGFLTLKTNFVNQIKRFVSDILDVDDMAFYSSLSKKEEIVEYFQRSVSWVNEKFGTTEGDTSLVSKNPNVDVECHFPIEENHFSAEEVKPNNLAEEHIPKTIEGYTKNIFDEASTTTATKIRNDLSENQIEYPEAMKPRVTGMEENVQPCNSEELMKEGEDPPSDIEAYAEGNNKKNQNSMCHLDESVNICTTVPEHELSDVPKTEEPPAPIENHLQNDIEKLQMTNDVISNTPQSGNEPHDDLITFSCDHDVPALQSENTLSVSRTDGAFLVVSVNSGEISLQYELLEDKKMANGCQFKESECAKSPFPSEKSNSRETKEDTTSDYNNPGRRDDFTSEIAGTSTIMANKQAPATLKAKIQSSDFKTIDRSHISRMPEKRIVEPTSDDKQAIDEKFLGSIDAITKRYSDAINVFLDSEGSISKDKLHNKHSVLQKEAVDKLYSVCYSLKLKEDDKEQKIKQLKTSLKLKHDKLLKEIQKSTNSTEKRANVGKDGTNTTTKRANEQTSASSSKKAKSDNIAVNSKESSVSVSKNEKKIVQKENHGSTKTTSKKDITKNNHLPPPTSQNAKESQNGGPLVNTTVGSSAAPIGNPMKGAFQERAEKLKAKYLHDIIGYIHINGNEETALRKFHNKVVGTMTKHLRDTFLSTNDHTDEDESRLTTFQSQLDDEFSRYLPAPEENVNMVEFTAEEFDQILADKSHEQILMMVKATEHVQNRYDAFMQNAQQRNNNAAQLNFAHHKFLQELTFPTFWSDHFNNQPNFLLNKPYLLDHFTKLIGRQFQLYDQRLKSTFRAHKLLEQLSKYCLVEYKKEIYNEVAARVKKIGFTSIGQLVTEVHEDLVVKIAKTSCPENVDFILPKLKEGAQQELQKVLKLDPLLKMYRKEMEAMFKNEICFSDINLSNGHEQVKKICMSGLHSQGDLVSNKNLVEVAEIAVDYAKCWYVNYNEEIQKVEEEAAEHAMKVVIEFYRKEINTTLQVKLHSSKQLTELHKDLKTQCIDAFKKSAPFFCNTNKSGLKDFSWDLECKIENLLGEHLEANEKNVEKAVMILKKITSNSTKKFQESMHGNISANTLDPCELEKIYEETKTVILNELRGEIVTKIPTEGADLHLEILNTQMEMDMAEMRDTNKAKRDEEALKIRKEQEEYLQNEATRGISTQCLCIEFNISAIQIGFTQPDGKFTNVVDYRAKISMPNQIAFLKSDEVIVGHVAEEKIKDISKTFTLENLLTSFDDSSDTKEYPPKIQFRGETLEINLELFCSLVFTYLIELSGKQYGENFSTAIISVPLWFASRHRQVIKATALIAGFEEAFLINDTSAAALGHITSAKSKVLVIAAGKKSCNAAAYSYKNEKLQMISNFGDLHIPPIKKSIWDNIFRNPFSADEKEDSVHTKVIKAIKLDKHVKEAIILDYENSEAIHSSCSKALRQKEICRVTVAGNWDSPSLVLEGLCKYSSLLMKNIKSAKESVAELSQYKLVYTEDLNDTSYPIFGKNQKTSFTTNTKKYVNNNTEKSISFYEEATELNRFHYGRANILVKDGSYMELRVSLSQECIYDVMLTVEGSLIDIDSYGLTDQERSKYSAIMEKHFKADPALMQLEQAKLELKEIAEEMLARFDQVTAKGQMVRDKIKDDITSAITLAENPSINLETVEAKMKTLKTWREKKFPKI